MKLKSKLLFLIALICSAKDIHAQTKFQKTFGSAGLNIAAGAQQTNDGGYIFTGFVDNGGTGGSDVILIKTDFKGDTLWTKVFGGPGDDGGRSVQQTADSGYIVTGFSASFNDDVYLVKTDADGNLQWSKTYGGADTQEGESVMQTSDGGYIISAEDFSQYLKIFLIRTNVTGDTLWTKTVDMPGSFSRAYSIKQTSDEGYILTGYLTTTAKNVYLIKTNSEGDTLWTRTYIDNYPAEARDVDQTTDGGYIVAGRMQGPAGDNAFLFKTNSTGAIEWTKTYGYIGDDGAYAALQGADGSFAIAGQTNSFGGGGEDAYIIKTDTVGALIWSGTFGDSGDDAARGIAQTNDGGYILNGFTTDASGSNLQGFIVKTDANGNSGCNWVGQATTTGTMSLTVTNAVNLISRGCTVANAATILKGPAGLVTLCSSTGIPYVDSDDKLLHVFPNPVTDDLFIEGTTGNGLVLIVDISGRHILEQKTNSGKTTIALKKVSPGFYTFVYTDGLINRIEKFIKQ